MPDKFLGCKDRTLKTRKLIANCFKKKRFVYLFIWKPVWQREGGREGEGEYFSSAV